MYKNKENNFTGLTEEEVRRSREEHGSNKLPDPELKKWWEFALDALKEPITVILIVITIVTLILSILGVEHISGPILTLIVIGLVTGIAVKTNTAIQKSTENLRRKTAIRYCEVIRDGEVKTINADDLVVGDITMVTLGQEIHADGYLIDGKISVSNAVINGEAEECKKTVIQDYVYEKDESTDAYKNQNHLFAGTVVVAGEGLEKVTVVGKDTVNGETLINMQTLEAPKTALDIALGKLANFINKWGTIAAIIAFVTMTVSGIMQAGLAQYFSGNVLEIINKIAANVSNAATIIVAAVPEGLPLIVKLVTKQNVNIMEKFNILAKNPNKIPELAYVNLICTDKTGTLTTGVMSPEVIVDGEGNEVRDNSDLAKTLCIVAMCILFSNVKDFDLNEQFQFVVISKYLAAIECIMALDGVPMLNKQGLFDYKDTDYILNYMDEEGTEECYVSKHGTKSIYVFDHSYRKVFIDKIFDTLIPGLAQELPYWQKLRILFSINNFLICFLKSMCGISNILDRYADNPVSVYISLCDYLDVLNLDLDKISVPRLYRLYNYTRLIYQTGNSIDVYKAKEVKKEFELCIQKFFITLFSDEENKTYYNLLQKMKTEMFDTFKPKGCLQNVDPAKRDSLRKIARKLDSRDISYVKQAHEKFFCDKDLLYRFRSCAEFNEDGFAVQNGELFESSTGKFLHHTGASVKPDILGIEEIISPITDKDVSEYALFYCSGR